jgi:hypothetical protein
VEIEPCPPQFCSRPSQELIDVGFFSLREISLERINKKFCEKHDAYSFSNASISYVEITERIYE